MEAILIPIFICFGLPVAIVFIRSYYSFRLKQLEKERDPKQLEASEEEKRERKELEARIQNLESIVCSVDFELNQRLNRLAAQTSQALPLPGGAPRPALALQAGPAEPAELAYGLGQLGEGQVVLERYLIERELGRGGMGAVYLAQDKKLGEPVALKTISSLIAADPGDLGGTLRREVQAARKITHPNVVRIHDLHEDGPLFFLSMEYIDGETLWARVRRAGPLPLKEGCQVLRDIAAGVAAAHAAGIVHRDLKPHNVILSRAGSAPVVKIIDFGIAHGAALSGTTATGIILGTPEYMSPEQIRGGAGTDARSDVYALGTMAYFALCGRPPFERDTPIATAFAQVHDQPRPPRELRPEIPASLEETILRALRKDPGARFPDASAWRRALEGA